MNYLKLLVTVITVSTILVIASEDFNTSGNIIASDVNLSGLIINNGAGVMNNQHTEQP